MRYPLTQPWSANLVSQTADELEQAIVQLEEMKPNQLLEAARRFFSDNGLRLLWVVGIFIFGNLLIKALLRLIHKLLGNSKVDSSLHTFIQSVVRIICNVLLLLTCLGILNIPLTPLVTAIGAVGLALSLALQDTLGNIAGGISIMFTQPFSKGNFVEIGGAAGTVVEIGLVYTLLQTVDNKHVYLPNGDVAKATIVNYSREKLRRVDIVFPVRADADLEKVKRILLEVADRAPLAVKEPEPIVRASDLTFALIKVSCLVWVESANALDLKAYLIENARKSLSEAGY